MSERAVWSLGEEPGRESSRCRGLEGSLQLACSRTNEARVVGEEWVGAKRQRDQRGVREPNCERTFGFCEDLESDHE